ncbi:hypothetical protein AGMMS49525_16380 [Bacteroidia bacterium]|nr:hypothetical protein AGMMS49525_16380 [Bacteroidia bacterium]
MVIDTLANSVHYESLNPYFKLNKRSIYFTLNTDEFCIFFPEDAHAPGVGNGNLKKWIVKVILSLFIEENNLAMRRIMHIFAA